MARSRFVRNGVALRLEEVCCSQCEPDLHPVLRVAQVAIDQLLCLVDPVPEGVAVHPDGRGPLLPVRAGLYESPHGGNQFGAALAVALDQRTDDARYVTLDHLARLRTEQSVGAEIAARNDLSPRRGSLERQRG